jgi:hypothetical protein
MALLFKCLAYLKWINQLLETERWPITSDIVVTLVLKQTWMACGM